jgi:hypothetical protein
MEEALLDRITVARLLSSLTEEPRMVLELVCGMYFPDDWPWEGTSWPPTYAEIGWYVGHKTRGKPLSEATIRYIRTSALKRLRTHLNE